MYFFVSPEKIIANELKRIRQNEQTASPVEQYYMV